MCRGDSMLLYTMTKETLSARVSGKTMDRLEKYADEAEISKSEATDRVLTQGLDVEESDMRLIPVQTDGGTKIENRLDSFEKSMEEQSQVQNRQIAGAIVGLLWIAIHVVFSVPSIITVVTGTPLAILMMYITLKANEWGFSNE